MVLMNPFFCNAFPGWSYLSFTQEYHLLFKRLVTVFIRDNSGMALTAFSPL